MANAQAVPVEGAPSPWGFWATVGLSVLVLLVFGIISAVVAIAVAVAEAGAGFGEFLIANATNGFIAFLGLSLAAPLCVGLVLWFIKLKATLSVEAYLGLVPVRVKSLAVWFGLLALLLIGSDLLTLALDRPIAPEVMVELYRTSRFAALAWFAVIVAAPVFEEVLFRGFMFRGIQASALGNRGAIVISAAVWAVIHIQYDAYLIATIFVLGILFGAARAVTGSLYPAIALHAVTNLIATVEMHLFAGS